MDLTKNDSFCQGKNNLNLFTQIKSAKNLFAASSDQTVLAKWCLAVMFIG